MKKSEDLNVKLDIILKEMQDLEDCKNIYFIKFLNKKHWLKEHLPELINTTVMTAGFARLIGLSKNPVLKVVGIGLVGVVNLVMLHEKYKKEFNEYFREKKMNKAKTLFSNLSILDIVNIIDMIRTDEKFKESDFQNRYITKDLSSVDSWSKEDILIFFEYLCENKKV